MSFKKICVNGISYGDGSVGEQHAGITNVDFNDTGFMKIVQDPSAAEYQNIM